MKIVIVILVLAAAVIAAPVIEERARSLRYIFSFGDSYTDTSFRPTSTLPSSSCPLGNPSCLVGGSYTGGHNWLTALTSLSNKTTTVTYNLAHSGDVVDGTVVPGRNSIISNQLPSFVTNNLTSTAQYRTAANTLFSFFIGINDIGATMEAGNVQLDAEFFTRMYDSYFSIVERLYTEFGARRFLFLNTPDTSRTPKFLKWDAADQAELAAAVKANNEELAGRVADFSYSHRGVKMYVWDSYSFFNNVLDAPEEYGFADATSICKPECFWNDDYHPTTKAHLLFAADIAGMLRRKRFW
ncbi:hypothetical protein EDC01DRAFT_46620 [Geopyxis carbonaria]|nr:hypothetical protein EDC01DRAFT_46620 [Geopyxis carbonaria]